MLKFSLFRPAERTNEPLWPRPALPALLRPPPVGNLRIPSSSLDHTLGLIVVSAHPSVLTFHPSACFLWASRYLSVI